jgi:lipid A 4'-phosphatase
MRYILLLLGCLFFYFYPDIDLKVASFFYNNGFYLKDTLFAKFVYKATMVVMAIFILSILTLLFYDFFLKKEIVKRGILIYLLAVLIAGPGIIVNEIFKNHFGRARPSQIKEFNGTKNFTPPLVIANECKKNCSFSSGHAAAAFYFIAFSFIIKKAKKILFFIALLWGILVGFVRIIQGGHFLSDVYCSFVVVYFTATIFYKIFLKGRDETISSNTNNE